MSKEREVTYDIDEPTGDEEKIPEYEGETLYERLGGVYSIASAVDVLFDRLYENEAANENPAVKEIHEEYPKAGFKYLVTAWTVEHTGGPAVYPGRGMQEAHADLDVTERDFDAVRTEIKDTLYYVGVPHQEMTELMKIIDAFRDEVVADEHRDESWEPP
jgi:hemoglobin